MKKISEYRLNLLIDALDIKFHFKDNVTGERYPEPRAYLTHGFGTKTRQGVRAVIERVLFEPLPSEGGKP